MIASRTLLLPVMFALAAFSQSGAMGQTPSPTTPPPAVTDTPSDPFGEQVTMAETTIVYLEGSGKWDSAFETIVAAFRSVYDAMGKTGAKQSGAPMTIYTETDNTGFQFQAAVPVAQAPAPAPDGNIKVGKSPTGTALKFVHRGSYDEMDTTYNAIAHHLDEKRLEAKDDLLVEQFLKDPVTTPEDDLVIEIYVPLK